MTQEQAKLITSSSTRCTQAALRAFDVNDAIPHYGSGCLSYLRSAGYSFTAIPCEEMPLRKFKYYSNKNYLLSTHNHVMALIQGTLVDTLHGSMDNRKLEHAWEVWKELK